MTTKPPCPTCLQFQDFLPSNSSAHLYLNLAQSVTVSCPDGSKPIVNIPAGVIGYVLNFSLGTPPYPDLVLNCVGGQIIVPVPDDTDQDELNSLIQSLLNQCVNKVALQSGCVAGSFVSVQQQVTCGSGLFVTVPGALPVGVTVSQDGHSLVATAGLISSTISVADANSKAIQLLNELLSTKNAVCTSVTPPPVPPPTPDKIWYKYVEGTGSTTVDFSAAGNNGQSITGWTTGPTGDGAVIISTAGLNSTSNSSWASGDFSYSLWIKQTGTPSSFFPLIEVQFFSGGSQHGMVLAVNSSNNLEFMAVAPTVIATHGTIAPGVWQMVTFTYNHTTGLMTIYLNGVSQGSTTTVSSFTDGLIYIGGDSAFGGVTFAGDIADTRIWSQELAAADVLNIFNAGAQ
jgi:hypothetical protein